MVDGTMSENLPKIDEEIDVNATNQVAHKKLLDDVCPDCGSRAIIRDKEGGEYVCGDCGLVIGEILSTEPEQGAFDFEQRETRSRTGAFRTELRPDRGMSTVIGHKNEDFLGRKLDIEAGHQMFRLRKLDSRSKLGVSRGRNLGYALSYIDKISSDLHLPKFIAEDAAVIYRKALNGRLLRGWSIEDTAVACAYYSTRLNNVEKHLKEIAQKTNRKKKDIGRIYRFLLRKLELKPHMQTIRDVLPKIFAGLEEKEIQEYTLSIADNLTSIIEMERETKTKKVKYGKGGQDVSSNAAAILYTASEITKKIKPPGVIQKRIANAAFVTEVTLRNRYGALIEFLDWKREDLGYMAEIAKIVWDYNSQKISFEEIEKEFRKSSNNDMINITNSRLEAYVKRLHELSIIDEIVEREKCFYKPVFEPFKNR